MKLFKKIFSDNKRVCVQCLKLSGPEQVGLELPHGMLCDTCLEEEFKKAKERYEERKKNEEAKKPESAMLVLE